MIHRTLDSLCPCGNASLRYRDCCFPYHHHQREAPTAVALMRSRYSAFALGDLDYLRYSWDPSTVPSRIAVDSSIEWTQLEVTATSGGGLFDVDGTVTFTAHYRRNGVPARHVERSRFSKKSGRWFYVDGD